MENKIDKVEKPATKKKEVEVDKTESLLKDVLERLNNLEKQNKELIEENKNLVKINQEKENIAHNSGDDKESFKDLLSALVSHKKEDVVADTDRLVSLIFLGDNAVGLSTFLNLSDGRQLAFRKYGDTAMIKLHEFHTLYNRYRDLFDKDQLFTVADKDIDVVANIGFSFNTDNSLKREEIRNLVNLTPEELKAAYTRVNAYYKDLICSNWVRGFTEGVEGYRDIEKITALNIVSNHALKALYDTLVREQKNDKE